MISFLFLAADANIKTDLYNILNNTMTLYCLCHMSEAAMNFF